MRVRRVAGQMEAAEALDGEDLAVAQQLGGRADGATRVRGRALGERDDVALRADAPAPAPQFSLSSRTLGPQTGHALGSAWKRRSAGSSYSARHAGHSGKRRMVVRSRSYGKSSMIVKRGPQSVQLVKGYSYRRSWGSSNSARQATQVARSGETSW